MKKIHVIVTLFLALSMFLFGLNKFLNFIPMPPKTAEQMQLMNAFAQLAWIMPLVAVTEIVSSILLVVKPTRALGALVLLPVMVGIIVHHLTFDPATLVFPLILFVANIWIILSERTRLKAIIS